jgi:hypothetical protein
MRPLWVLAVWGMCLGVEARAEDLNTELMHGTVKIYNDKASASAFLLTRPLSQDIRKEQVILVTGAHVFDNMPGDSAFLLFRQQVADGVYKKAPLRILIRKDGKPLWSRHPSADVAVLVVTPPPGCTLSRLPVDLLATDETVKRHGIHPGDTLMALGYPHRIEANDAGFPILRTGAVASFPLTPAKTHKTFLASINIFEGDSGGPVYFTEANRMSADKKPIGDVRLILGLVSSQQFLDEDVRLPYEIMKIRHRLGLANVVPAAFIRETIERLPRMP